MILDDKEIAERIESPLNLLNKLRSVTRSSVPARTVVIPSLPVIPKATDLIPNIDEKIAEASSRTKAFNIMNKAMDALETRIPDIQKPETLSSIATNMSKIITNQNVSKASEKGHTSQIIVYAPQIQSLDSFEVIDISER